MMGPHWNSMATEIAIVLEGSGIVRVVCSSVSNVETVCKNMRFEVEEGDVFAVLKFHPMVQMAFNNDTFVFMGFSTIINRNPLQFLAGQASVLRTLDKDVLALSFNITNTTLDKLLAPRDDSVILACTSCAEEEFQIMEEEAEAAKEQREEEEGSGAEEEEQGGGGGEGAPRGTELQQENHDDHEWGRRIAKNKKKRLTV